MSLFSVRFILVAVKDQIDLRLIKERVAQYAQQAMNLTPQQTID